MQVHIFSYNKLLCYKNKITRSTIQCNIFLAQEMQDKDFQQKNAHVHLWPHYRNKLLFSQLVFCSFIFQRELLWDLAGYTRVDPPPQ